MVERRLVTIGASAGGVQALVKLVHGLPSELGATVLVAMHLSPDVPSHLATVVGRATDMPTVFASDGMPLAAGTIVIAPPGAHMLLNDGTVSLSSGPKEHGERPSIDPLFRSAAATYGRSVIGVLLSGSLDDGVAGLAKIVAEGGTAMVQSPEDAIHPSMPLQALRRVQVEESLPADELGRAIGMRISEKELAMSLHEDGPVGGPDEAAIEEMPKDASTGLTCPACGGAIWELRNDGVTVLRCHVGHSYGLESFAEAQSDETEAALWEAIRALEERRALLMRMADSADRSSRTLSAGQLRDAAADLDAKADKVRRLVELLLAPGGPLDAAAVRPIAVDAS
ncbi:MAG TPA: chemotaxis protein CheB [Actinomycetota bacterium]|nr:chemotaxis protein CheB [Actinomycetota bacterium]